MIHWQNDLELLYLVDGDAEITSDHQRCTFSPGQIAVINCTCLHSVKAINQSCSYYCLIVGQNYLEQQGIPISELAFSSRLMILCFGKNSKQSVLKCLKSFPFINPK